MTESEYVGHRHGILHREHRTSPAGTEFELLWEDVTGGQGDRQIYRETYLIGFVVGTTWFRFFAVENNNAGRVEYDQIVEVTPGAIPKRFDVGHFHFDPVWVDRILMKTLLEGGKNVEM